MSEDPRDPRLQDVIDHALETFGADLHVSMPGRVQSYDATKQSADVQPITKQTFTDEDGEEQVVAFPVIRNVPVVFPGAGGFRITFPMKAGDDVLLVFSDLGIDKYLSNGGAQVDPIGLQSHHLADAIAIPGLHPFSSPWTGAGGGDMTLGKDGGAQVHITATQILLGTGAVKKVAQGEDLNVAIAALGTAISGALTTMGAAPGTPMPGSLAVTAGSAIATAVTTFNTAAALALSNTVKVKP